eukprot:TRINITY_DN21574_c0_g1_i1.p3 TRINITY_DN21574_c0_g1~~TRINITY_DN21574_c0_g1_i1.p3  ORF type:complete len:100 (-),score=32.61 TRINITY_DN21574_c0_g1_i1:253-552(-)
MKATERFLPLSHVEVPDGEVARALDAALKAGQHAKAAAISEAMGGEEVRQRLEEAVERAESERKYATEQDARRQQQRKKRPRIQYGFAIKERWERKGNM